MAIDDLQLRSLVYAGADQHISAELQRLSELVGLDFTQVAPGDKRTEGVLRFTSADLPPLTVEARFHEFFAPYFADGSVRLHVRDDLADLLELMSAVGATQRGRVIGVCGAQGGSGTTTVALLLARCLAIENDSVALADFNPYSTGLDRRALIAQEPGLRWADIADSGALLPGKFTNALPRWQGVRVLSADPRRSPEVTQSAVLGALAQTHAWTVVDLGVARAEADFHTLREWCDQLILVTRADGVELRDAKACLDMLGNTPVTVVANSVFSHSEAASIAQTLRVREVHQLRHSRTMNADLDHGVHLGDRKASGMYRDLRKVLATVKDSA